jgi:hypothetical protein
MIHRAGKGYHCKAATLMCGPMSEAAAPQAWIRQPNAGINVHGKARGWRHQFVQGSEWLAFCEPAARIFGNLCLRP